MFMCNERRGFDRGEFDKILCNADYARIITTNGRGSRVTPVCFEVQECGSGSNCGCGSNCSTGSNCGTGGRGGCGSDRVTIIKFTGGALSELGICKGKCITAEFEAAFAGRVMTASVECTVCDVDSGNDCCCSGETTVTARVRDVDIECFDVSCI